MPDYNLKAALSKCKGKPQRFFLFKGGKGAAMLVTAAAPTAVMLAEMKEKTGVDKPTAKGTCVLDGKGKAVLASSSSLSAHESSIKKAMFEGQCGQFLPVKLRQLGDDAEEGSDSEKEETLPPPPPPPPESKREERVPQGSPAPEGPVVTPPSSTRAPESKREGRTPEGPSAPEGPVVTPPSPKLGELEAVMNQLIPKIKTAVGSNPGMKDEILKPVAAFQSALKARDASQAKATLGKVVAALKKAAASKSPQTSGDGNRTGLVAYRTSLLAWDGAKKQVGANIEKLRTALLANAPDRVEVADSLAKVLNVYDADLSDKLDAAMNATSASEREGHHKAALARLKQYQKLVQSDPLLSDVDANPLGVAVNARKTLSAALSEVASHLGSLDKA